MRLRFAPLLLLLAAGPALAQTRPAPPPAAEAARPGRPGWSVDAANGCWLWNPNPQPGDAVRWSGPCPQGPAEGEGSGEWRYSEGGQPRLDRFSGRLRDGRLDGQGRFMGQEGAAYEGAWRDGQRHGEGRFTWPNGDRYVGAFEEDRMQGRGSFTWANGNRYEGEFREDRMAGRGTYVWANGARYKGQFLDDRPEGQGTYRAADGSVLRGAWRGGCLQRATPFCP